MKTWKSALNGQENEKMNEFLSSKDIELDKELVKWDILSTIAHEIMLANMGLLGENELKKILEQLLHLYENGLELDKGLEDVHSNIEAHLIKELGTELGKKVHTLLSRNDKVVTDLKLFMKQNMLEIAGALLDLIKELNKKAKETKNVVVPGYTHYQQAMPYTFGSYLTAYVCSLLDDLELLVNCYKILDASPLGAGAGFGFPLKPDKELTTGLLGFAKPQENSLYAINSRGKNELMLISVLNQIALTINKIATDLVLFSTKEFDIVELGKEFTTGSSLMPQKKNPDVLELIKGKLSLLLGNYNAVFDMQKNLLSGYNKDLQESKHCLFSSLKEMKNCLFALKQLIPTLKAKKGDLNNEIFATSFALKMAKQGKPYKVAYSEVAEMIEKGKKLPECDVEPDIPDMDGLMEEQEKKITDLKNEFEGSIEKLISYAENFALPVS